MKTPGLSDVAQWVWEHRKSVVFGEHTGDWPGDLFGARWFDRCQCQSPLRTRERSGWYWFELEGNIEGIIETDGVPTAWLPAAACKFGPVAEENVKRFGDLLCHRQTGFNVVYNGHEKDVAARVRSHFAVRNDSTGALGLSYYPRLAGRRWTLSFLHTGLLAAADILDNSAEIVRIVKGLAASKSGRVAVESAWRAVYGWPLLCKG